MLRHIIFVNNPPQAITCQLLHFNYFQPVLNQDYSSIPIVSLNIIQYKQDLVRNKYRLQIT